VGAAATGVALTRTIWKYVTGPVGAMTATSARRKAAAKAVELASPSVTPPTTCSTRRTVLAGDDSSAAPAADGAGVAAGAGARVPVV
jgi:hypothetical protein